MDHKRVAIYARVSTTDQDLENQLFDLRKYCESRRWPVVGEFTDFGISGAAKDRPALRELMDAVHKRRMDCVLVWRFDRFARSSSHLVNTLDTLRERNIDFASYQEGIDTGTSHGKMVFTIIAAMAEFERELTRERLRATNRRKRDAGERLGRMPIPQQTINGILEGARQGLSLRAIAAALDVSKSVVHNVVKGKHKGVIALPAPVGIQALAEA